MADVGRPTKYTPEMGDGFFSDCSTVPSVSGVYALCCPDSGSAKYVGQSRNIRKRAYSHFNGDGSVTPKSRWVQKLQKAGKNPVVRVLYVGEDLDKQEKHFIKMFGTDTLLNIHMGGKGAFDADPKIWRVLGVGTPSKILWNSAKASGAKAKVLDDFREWVSSASSERDRAEKELKVASSLLRSPVSEKIQKWIDVALPKIKQTYPDMFYE